MSAPSFVATSYFVDTVLVAPFVLFAILACSVGCLLFALWAGGLVAAKEVYALAKREPGNSSQQENEKIKKAAKFVVMIHRVNLSVTAGTMVLILILTYMITRTIFVLDELRLIGYGQISATLCLIICIVRLILQCNNSRALKSINDTYANRTNLPAQQVMYGIPAYQESAPEILQINAFGKKI